MTTDNQFFSPVREFCSRNITSCAASTPLVTAAELMHEHNISSIIVCEADQPIGIFTDRDLRNKVIARGLDPNTLLVADIMTRPLAVIHENDVLYQALYLMSRQGIHRLGVVNDAGLLVGIITDTDILRLQAHSPHQLVLDIEKANTINDLRQLHERIQQLIVHMTGTGIDIRELVRLIAHLNDQVIIRLIALLRAEKYPHLTQDFAFVVMGSEGRSEQTLSTDQDNAIIYADTLSDDELAVLEAFSIDLIDAIIAIGIPPCSGGIMAKNPAWRRSLGSWKQELNRWLSTPVPANIMLGSMFMDFRILHGDVRLEQALRQHLFDWVAKDRGFIMRMAQSSLSFPPPFGWFGKIKLEREGPYAGQLDIKKAGIFAITDGVKALSLEAHNLNGSTHDRIEHLVAKGVIAENEARDLIAAFDFLVTLRLRSQVEALRKQRAPSNYVCLTQLNLLEQGELRIALQTVGRFQDFLKHRLNLKFLNN
jgi:CBS domain-containing protein